MRHPTLRAALALAATSRFRPELVITDLRMDQMDGIGLLKELQSRYPGLKVIILTAHGSYDVARKAQTIGADDYLLKPVNPDQLHAALAKTFEKGVRAKSGPLSKLSGDGHGGYDIFRFQPAADVMEKWNG